MLNLVRQNARFIVPIPWLALSGMKLWNAVETGQFALYLAAGGFALVAVLFYFVELNLLRKRQAAALGSATV